MKLTKSTNICYISDRVASTIKVDIKETFMGIDVYVVNRQQSKNNRPIS